MDPSPPPSRSNIVIPIERGDVVVRAPLENSGIDTGHSCSITAEARNVKVEAKMVNSKDKLNLYQGFQTDGQYYWQNLVVGDVPHVVDVTMDVHFRFGAKLLGKCHKYARKTCSGKATSTGINEISVSLEAKEVSGFTRDGQDFVEFQLDVTVESEPSPRTYSPMAFSTAGRCRLPFNIAKLTGRAQKYGAKYLASKKTKIDKIRSAGLIAKLEKVLETELGKDGKIITIPVNVAGGSGRRKRAAGGKCQRMKCPTGYNRIGNTQKCTKFFGTRRPNCAAPAVIRTKTITIGGGRGRTISLYFCDTPMVAA